MGSFRAFASSWLLLAAIPGSAQTILLHDVAWFAESGELLRGVDVEIGDAVRVRPHAAHPAGAEVVDATGKFALPGFTDMHAHVLEHGRDENGGIPPRIDWDLARRALRLLLAHGVTTIRDPGSETEAAVTLRGMLARGEVDGPRLLTAGRILNASSFDPEPFQPVRTAAEVRSEIRWQKAAGVDFIKIYAAVPPELAKVAIDEAHAVGLPVIGHLQRTSWLEAARLGIDFIAHGAPWSPDLLPASKRHAYRPSMFGRVYWLESLDLDSEEVRATLEELAKRRVVVDPTLVAYHTKFFGNDPRWLSNPDNALVPERLVRGWKAGSFTRDWAQEQYAAAQAAWPKMLALTRRMFERGVRLGIGTDTPTAWIVPGASFHDEMRLLVSAGIPAREVLRMAAYGPLPSKGSVLLLSRNPLDDIAHTRAIEAIFNQGRRYDPRTLGAGAARRPASAKAGLTWTSRRGQEARVIGPTRDRPYVPALHSGGHSETASTKSWSSRSRALLATSRD